MIKKFKKSLLLYAVVILPFQSTIIQANENEFYMQEPKTILYQEEKETLNLYKYANEEEIIKNKLENNQLGEIISFENYSKLYLDTLEIQKKDKEEENKKRIVKEKKAKQIETSNMGVCKPNNNSMKTYMDGGLITAVGTKQYELIHTMHVDKRGHYITDDGYIGVALGSYYGSVGTKYIVKLDSGKTLKVIKTDEKSDNHTVNGCYHASDGSLLEMVIDTKTATNYHGGQLSGNFNDYEEFRGSIIEIKKVIN